MDGIALWRCHKTPCCRMSWTWCVGTYEVSCTRGSHPRDHPPGPGGKTPRSVRNTSRRTSSWHLCWSTWRTWTNQPGPTRQHGAACTGPHEPKPPHHNQPQPAADGRNIFQDGVMTRKGDSRATWVPNSGTLESRHLAVSLVVTCRRKPNHRRTTPSTRPRWRKCSRSTVTS